MTVGLIAERARSVKFTEEELLFIAGNQIARVATASREGQPHVVPVAYEFDGRAFYFGGWSLSTSLKFRNILGNEKVALVIDDVVSVRPWRPRGLEVRGTAKALNEGGRDYVMIVPTSKRSWGLGQGLRGWAGAGSRSG